MPSIAIFLGGLLMAFSAGAHHSVAAFYDSDTISERSGTITSIDWINPHVRFTLETGDETWALESGSVNMLERHGVGRGELVVGNEVTVVGHLSRYGRNEMIAGYIKMPGGEQIVLWSGLFGGLEANESETDAYAPSTAIRPEGIFRVWSQGQTYTNDATDTSAGMALPLTAAAVAARDQYDPLTDDTALRCIPQGMPGIMDNPFPMEFVTQSADIALRLEEWDVVRLIHMSEDADAEDHPPSPWGYSVGSFQDDTLVVITTQIDWLFFDDVGTPLGEGAEIVERFTLRSDEDRLDYTIRVTDPTTFSQPITMEGYWIWIPGEQIKPYNCTL